MTKADKAEELLIRSREAAEEASDILSSLEDEFYSCGTEDDPEQVHFWGGFTEVDRKKAKAALRQALEKLEACERVLED